MTTTTAGHKTVRTRYAPSPTGFTHIGNFRTALFAFLFARHHDGKIILRIEDTDQSRKVEGAVENLLQIMNRMGVEFDEGPYLQEDGTISERGSLGPYVQSERLGIYHKAAEDLIAKQKAYYCFCDAARLDEVRKEQVALKKPPMYDRHCRKLNHDEVSRLQNEFTQAGKRPVVRQAIPETGTTTVQDLIYGNIEFDNTVLDDQVLIKSDGFPTYHLAVVVDDHAMAITHVIRGEDWINSTPKHVLLYEAFGWEPTSFAHAPNILNENKTKLSKRQGDVTVEDFLRKGYMPEALVNFVAFLGWNPKTEQELFSMQELIAQFDLEKINKAGAVFDGTKLDWMNGTYIRQKSDSSLVELCSPYWVDAGIDIAQFKPDYLEAVVRLEKDRLKKLSDITEHLFYFQIPEYEAEMLSWKKSTPEDAKRKLQALSEYLIALPQSNFGLERLEESLKKFIADSGYDNGSVLWPLRVALTGLPKSPGPFEVAATLFIGWGRAGILDRIAVGIEKLS